MSLAEFIRLYPLRCKNMALLCGAGTSISAGMPSANDLVWEFKRLIYCTEERYPLSLFSNLSSVAIRNQIQGYFDSKGNCPKYGSIDEYSFYFELAFPSAKDRSNYLMQKLTGMQNSFGHKVLGILMKNSFAHLIFTTNFDKAFENAAIDQLKTMDKFFVASTDNTATAIQKYHVGLRPFIVKLHGDYFSEKLKNTSEELKNQDSQLRDILFHACLSNGLLVFGYSGRDESVMAVLNRAIDQGSSFPQGIFWFKRAETELLPVVNDFIEKAKSKQIQAEVIDIETFDTAWAEIIKGFPELSQEDFEKINTNYYKTVTAQLPNKGSKYPIIRFNAVRVLELPVSARLIKCNVGGTKEIVNLIQTQKSDILAIRKKDGVVGFGPDSEFDRVFSAFGPIEKAIFPIHENVLSYEDSTLKGLLTEALLKGIVKNGPLIFRKRRDRYFILPHPKKIADPIFAKLKTEVGQNISGLIPNTDISWIVTLEVSMQKKLSNYFLVLAPTILAGKTDNVAERLQIAPFVKEATARWYNSQYTKILDEWLTILFSDDKEKDFFSFDITIDGFNPKFKLKREAPFAKSN